jgi:putative restriction endonuclease
MERVDQDWAVRQHAFRFLDQLSATHGDVLPWRSLQDGFHIAGRRITLIGQRGIWKPAALDLPISIITSPKDPYGDEADETGLLQYRYYGSDPNHPDNVGLRRCFHEGRPLIYMRAVDKGWYTALWPMVLVNDDPGSLTFTGACEDVDALRPGVEPAAADEARRRYATRLAMTRLHQAKFRQRVLKAYQRSCTVCRLGRDERLDGLIDAAHILADRHERGEPVVRNGLALCKIHHAAFDMNIMGIRPDHVIEIRSDILRERDGPMLRHGLQALHGARLAVVPRQPDERPDPERLGERYEEFRAAG